MARDKKSDGFSMDNIVDTFIAQNIKDNVEIDDNDGVKDNDNVNGKVNVNVGVKSNENILKELKENIEPEKVRVQLYLEKDINNLLDYYGRKIGKAGGGKSKFTNEILRRFLEENSLWIEKVANKK